MWAAPDLWQEAEGLNEARGFSYHPTSRTMEKSGMRKPEGVGGYGWFPHNPQAVQKGCPSRPQRVKRRGVRFGTLSL